MPALDHPISATTLSHYVRLERCERYLRLTLRRDELQDLLRRFQSLDVEQQALSPLLRAAGQRFEGQVVEGLGGQVHALDNQDAAATTAALVALPSGETCYLTQAPVAGEIGGWPCVGRADIIRATRTRGGGLDLLVTDLKASAQDHVEYFLQVAFYCRLLRSMLASAKERLDRCQGAILKVGDGQALPALEDPANLFDLAPYDLTLDHLLAGDDADIARVLRAPLVDLAYSLSYKCDACVFNELCMVEKRGSPGCRPHTIRAACRGAGVAPGRRADRPRRR